jgi:hypothetical protein
VFITAEAEEYNSDKTIKTLFNYEKIENGKTWFKKYWKDEWEIKKNK